MNPTTLVVGAVSCSCGKSFETDLSCSRHKSSCKVYICQLEEVKQIFSVEGDDHVVCKFCNYKAKDLTRHLYEARNPHPSLEEYRKIYPESRLVCSEVNEKRKVTCLERYGDSNYRNHDAQSIGVQIAFSDPEIMKKIEKTKMEKYGDPHFVNAEQRKRTLMEKYGVDNPMKIQEVRDRVSHTMKSLYKDNPINRPPVIEKDKLIELHQDKGMSLNEIASLLGYTEGMVSYWMKKHEIAVKKRIVFPKSKKYESSINSVKEYMNICSLKNKVLSFSEYGQLTEDKKKQRLKRLFNSGKPYHHLLDELREVALKSDLWPGFLKNFEKEECEL